MNLNERDLKHSFPTRHILIASVNDGLKGGAEGVLLQIATFFRQKGCYIHVLFIRKKSFNEWIDKHIDGYSYYYLSVKSILLLSKLRFEKTFTSHPMLTGIIGVMRKIHLVKTDSFIAREPHTLTENKGIKRVIRTLYRKLGYSALDLLICQTELMKKMFIRYNPKSKIRIEVIPNPISIDREKEIVAIMPSVTNPYIVAAGRYVPEKAFDILIMAFSVFRKSHPEFKLVILGEKQRYPKFEKEIKELIRKFHLEESVILFGSVENVFPYFNQATMCIVSSRSEGFPNVLLQMMSQNEKVVSTLCAGDIDKIQGLFTCKTNDEGDLLRAMQQCLEADTSRNRELFDKELQNHSIEKFIEMTESYGNENSI
ncbi:MAG: glycosyltransferase [Tannerellaceae bacterium]|jgi:glycosyltransferase involved in cell wall biosynthesis|nr:glycosyltransferase [Tannerellaceae bacterium]